MKEWPHRLEVLPYLTVCASSAKKRLEVCVLGCGVLCSHGAATGLTLPVTGTQAIMTRFAEVVDERKEGLVMKEASSKYTCAARDERWVKLKPDYVGGFNRTFDCLVVGGYYGDGRVRPCCTAVAAPTTRRPPHQLTSALHTRSGGLAKSHTSYWRYRRRSASKALLRSGSCPSQRCVVNDLSRT